MKIYKTILYGGYIGLLAAENLEEAKKKALSEQGSSNVQSVTLASAEDVEWVKAMGGKVPVLGRNLLPSEWAQEGYFVIEGSWRPKVGDHCDYYDREGIKRQGTITKFDGQRIWIDGERTMIVKEEFNVRYGR